MAMRSSKMPKLSSVASITEQLDLVLNRNNKVTSKYRDGNCHFFFDWVEGGWGLREGRLSAS